MMSRDGFSISGSLSNFVLNYLCAVSEIILKVICTNFAMLRKEEELNLEYEDCSEIGSFGQSDEVPALVL